MIKVISKIKNYSLLSFFTIVLLSSFNSDAFSQQITGLAGWNIYLDPGHSQKENMGVYGYSEAEKNLRVGLNLRQMLLDWTDIDTVYICRDDDTDQVSLSQRTDQANSLGAAHYHSIHSNATADPTTTANSTLLLWGQLGINGPEKVPNGGKKMSDIMVVLLTAGMRTYTIGSIGDRTFYGGAFNYPYLHVNRESAMASELSEAGFHTNTYQNQLNMNDKWKRLEAKTFFWSILEYHGIARPFAGTVAGIIKDPETGQAINGAVVSLNGQVDTTDTWESLFYKYSSDPNFLRNGFYYFEDVPAGSFTLQVTAPNYELFEENITINDTFFTFKDVNLISKTPPIVVSTNPVQNDSLYPGIENLSINFSRPMDRSKVESNISITPNVSAIFSWSFGDKTLNINTSSFEFNSQYSITISGMAEDKYSHQLDGDGDGNGGDPYSFEINTKVQDVTPPFVADVYPEQNAINVELKPVVNLAFSEPLKTSTIASRFRIVRNSTQTNISGSLKHFVVNGRSVLMAFISSPLVENETYTVSLLAGIEDVPGNPTQNDLNFEFTTGISNYVSEIIIDNFDSGIGSWWQPTASGTTFGVVADSTKISSDNLVININTGSTKSLKFDYAYDLNETNWLIREYRLIASPLFDASSLLQAYVFGDGSNNKFRFAVRETSVSSYEVSPWINIDWIGWKIVSWDLKAGQTGTWIGNGVIEPPLIFDSFQFTYEPGNLHAGTLYFDDLRIASFQPTDVSEDNITVSSQFLLSQNYPNPFNPSTVISYQVPKTDFVSLKIYDVLGNEVATLINEEKSAGSYSINFNASKFPSGVYFYTLRSGEFTATKKLILMK